MNTKFFFMDKLYKMVRFFFKKRNGEKQYRMQMPRVINPRLPEDGVELTLQVEHYLENRYAFRFNEMTEQTEYRPRGMAEEEYRRIEQRDLNTFCMGARRSGINCWDKDISRYICSKSIPEYNPLCEYMERLPEWDGTDRVTPLAERVSHDEVWVEGFPKWMRAMAAQWMKLPSTHSNSVAPVLVSRRQGMNKSTFCRLLLPPALQDYYTDSFDAGSTGNAEQKLTAYGLINLDEQDKYSDRKMALLKSLMQMTSLSIRKAHKRSFNTLPRMASFIGTSNRRDLLTDPTGSRRFLCVDVEWKIDCSPIDHAQLYAQLKAELLAGKRSWFNTEEEAAVMRQNESFQKRSLAEDVFYSCFRLPSEDETGQHLSAIQIFNELKKRQPSSARLISSGTFGKTLVAIGVEPHHTKNGNLYHVMRA